MSYESRAYDRSNNDGFPPDPVVVLVVTGTHDVSRLVNLLNGGQPVVEQLRLRDRIVRQVKRHNAGRAALELLRAHGGPDFTEEPPAPLVSLRAQFADELRDHVREEIHLGVLVDDLISLLTRYQQVVEDGAS
jgi:hypothetical protein